MRTHPRAPGLVGVGFALVSAAAQGLDAPTWVWKLTLIAGILCWVWALGLVLVHTRPVSAGLTRLGLTPPTSNDTQTNRADPPSEIELHEIGLGRRAVRVAREVRSCYRIQRVKIDAQPLVTPEWDHEYHMAHVFLKLEFSREWEAVLAALDKHGFLPKPQSHYIWYHVENLTGLEDLTLEIETIGSEILRHHHVNPASVAPGKWTRD